MIEKGSPRVINSNPCFRQQLSVLRIRRIEAYQGDNDKNKIKPPSTEKIQNYLQETSSSAGSKTNYQRKKRICIVDDEIDVGLALKFILEEKGFRVDLFTDPVTASEIIKARRYDLFLTDIIMPDMNGFQIFKEIMSVNKRAKVCFITAFEDYHYAFKDELSRLGIAGFILKPIEDDELIKHVNKILSSK